LKNVITAAALALAPLSASAATIDLAALDLIPQTPVYTGSGDLTFEGGRVPILSDNTNVVVDGFTGSQLLLAFVESSSSVVGLSYNATNDEQFDVIAVGDNGDNMFELLLERGSFNSSDPDIGLGPNAIIRFTSDDFDFSQDAPFAFFESGNLIDYIGVTFEATSLYAIPAPVTPVPLSPSMLFLMTGIAGLGWVGMRSTAG